MKETLFSNSFTFNRFKYTKFRYTDARNGCKHFYIAYMFKGRCRIVSKNVTINCSEGQLFFIPKNLAYESYWYGDDIIEFLSLGFLGLGINDDLNYELQVIPADEALIRRVIAVSTDNSSPSCATLSDFYAVMDEILPVLKPAGGKDEYIAREAERYIRENAFCSVSDIAGACLVSEPYLYKIFKRHMGVTPNDFKCQILCKRAAEFLQTTDKSVEEISTSLGFSSAAYFRKLLKKYMGVTPRQIRNESTL